MRHVLLTLAFLILLSVTSTGDKAASANPADAILDDWYVQDSLCRVHIEKKNDVFTGTVTWMRYPRFPEGDPEAGVLKYDRLNPDPAKRQRPAIGLPLLENFRFDQKKNAWSGGTVYDPDSGKTYECILRIEKDVLLVRGYVGIPTFGRTVKWTRTASVPVDEPAESDREKKKTRE